MAALAATRIAAGSTRWAQGYPRRGPRRVYALGRYRCTDKADPLRRRTQPAGAGLRPALGGTASEGSGRRVLPSAAPLPAVRRRVRRQETRRRTASRVRFQAIVEAAGVHQNQTDLRLDHFYLDSMTATVSVRGVPPLFGVSLGIERRRQR